MGDASHSYGSKDKASDLRNFWKKYFGKEIIANLAFQHSKEINFAYTESIPV